MDPIRIMMLGPTQSGKTLYLSAMWQKLQLPLDPGFHLDAVTATGQPDSDARNRLDRIYAHLLNKPDFPPGTGIGSKSTYRFSCLIRSQNVAYTACTFEYMDYAGGLLSQESVIDPDFEQAISSADVLLGLIDGVRLLLAMENDLAARDWVANELAPVLISVATSLDQKQRRPVSIHFVISKWDAIQQLSPSRTLKEYRDFLLGFPPIQALLRLAGESATIRLIPFSSLGLGFAQAHAEQVEHASGVTTTVVHIRKRAVGESARPPIPLNVEIPIACALPDVLTQRLAELAAQESQVKKRLDGVGSSRLSTVGQRLEGIGVPLLRRLGSWLQRTQKERDERMSQSLLERHRSIRSSESALSYLVEFCTALRDSFEREEPDSILKRGTL